MAQSTVCVGDPGVGHRRRESHRGRAGFAAPPTGLSASVALTFVESILRAGGRKGGSPGQRRKVSGTPAATQSAVASCTRRPPVLCAHGVVTAMGRPVRRK